MLYYLWSLSSHHVSFFSGDVRAGIRFLVGLNSLASDFNRFSLTCRIPILTAPSFLSALGTGLALCWIAYSRQAKYSCPELSFPARNCTQDSGLHCSVFFWFSPLMGRLSTATTEDRGTSLLFRRLFVLTHAYTTCESSAVLDFKPTHLAIFHLFLTTVCFNSSCSFLVLLVAYFASCSWSCSYSRSYFYPLSHSGNTARK